MRILAMDTATSACSVALWCDGTIIQHRLSAMTRGQAEALAPMVADVLDASDSVAADLDLLAVTIGPGAFTGLRIGLAMARAMALALKIPCLGLTTTEAIAAAVEDTAWPTGTLLVALDSKRSDMYVQTFSKPGQATAAPQAVEPENLAAWMAGAARPISVVGDATVQALTVLAEVGVEAFAVPASGVADAGVVAALAARRWSTGDHGDPLAPVGPLYLRPPDAKLPRDGGSLRP